MPSFRTATVMSVTGERADGTQVLSIEIDGARREALLHPRWAARAGAGDRVVVNTTGADLGLGTGGVDFVVWNLAVDDYDAPSGGHIMKLRYTPGQVDVLAVEAPESPHHEVMAKATSLDGVPVVATALHSQLLPVLLAVRRELPDAKVAFVMTDGAALDAGFSTTLTRLRELAWLTGVVTCGHAMGGDLEAVTLHSGLLAARHVLGADLIIAGPGPGVVGTATPFGTTALDLGTTALATMALQGRCVVCVRLSEADPRPRHHGLSHHVASALRWVSSGIDPELGVAVVPPGWLDEASKALAPWPVQEHDPGDLTAAFESAASLGLHGSHMGRDPGQDAQFFRAAAAAGALAATLVRP